MGFLSCFAVALEPVGLRPRLAGLACGFAALFASPVRAAEPFDLTLRSRVETADGSGRFHAVTKPEEWNPAKTAILVCDVWDLHHSRNATLRTGELAPRIAALVNEVRRRGGTVLHCPSDCMAAYEGTPARKAAQDAPKAANLPAEIGTWCYKIPSEEQGVYPLDQSDGGGDDAAEPQATWLKELAAQGRKPGGPWLKEHEAIAVQPGDFVTDKGAEVWNVLEARGIENVLLCGVHTNMCVLGRPFGLRRLASNGKHVALVRDLTDTMYNPAMRPFVSHFTGTDLIVEHIEKFVCPTVTSDQIVGGEPFRFAGDDRPRVVLMISEPEYGTEITLPAFATRHLGRRFRITTVFGDAKEGGDFPGLETALKEADVLLVSVRRRSLRPEQMAAVRAFVEAGKPVVGIRTASHAFSLRGKEPPAGRVVWDSWDADVFGGSYTNHYGAGPAVLVTIADAARNDPLVTGLSDDMNSPSSLYQVSPLKASATPLLNGRLPNADPEPVAWKNATTFGGRAFYTSLGSKGDFETANFRRLLFNAVCWAAGQEVPIEMPDATAEGGGKERDGGAGERKQSGIDEGTPLSLGSGAGGEGAVVQWKMRTENCKLRIVGSFPSLQFSLLNLQFPASFISLLSKSCSETVPSPAPPSPLIPRLPSSFTVPADLSWKPILAEPDVAQPVFMEFDERGRLWVAQYLQYPYPAGLTMLSKDKHWRAVYDKTPEPPPHGVRGADKITIHEDQDGDGYYESQKTFIDGLNIATSFARGRGGVWVLNPPYLLFYPDRDGDDVPDSDPEVRLAGFGLEDTHSVVNSLRFGPDGWLYACQGSTVSGHVVRPGTDDKPLNTLGQLVWRYHPEQRIYEVFAEGGGNAFGLELDADGNLFSGHNGGDTRGFHYIQGGYSRKGFEKHGPLSNPHAYGFFEPMRHAKVPRFTHDFVIYEEGVLPEEYRGKLFGVEPLQGQVTLTTIRPRGSTFETEDVDRVVRSDDPKFRPVAITTGPDGAIYVADFHEEQIAHRDHFESRIEKKTGRIYRLAAAREGEASAEPRRGDEDLAALSSDELVTRLDDPSRWQRQTALRLLADRQDASVLPRLKRELLASGGRQPSEPNPEDAAQPRGADAPRSRVDRLWAIYQLGGLDDATTLAALIHDDPVVRRWAVRLACDDGEVSPDVLRRLTKRALVDPAVRVRVQLACSARRLPAAGCFALVRNLTVHDEDAADPLLPLSLWWAVEKQCGADPDAVVNFFRGGFWDRRLVRDVLAERTMRRFASGGRADLVRCAEILRTAPDAAARKTLLAGFEAALRGRPGVTLPPELVAALGEAGDLPLSLRLRRGDEDAVAEAVAKSANATTPAEERIGLVGLLGEVRPPSARPTLLTLFESGDAKLRTAALAALAGYDGPEVASALLAALPKRPAGEQASIVGVLVSRAEWSRRLVAAVRDGTVPAAAVPDDLVSRLLLHDDAALTAAVTELWPQAVAATPRTAADAESLRAMLTSVGDEPGDPYRGRRVFADSCARCHKLFGTGGEVGPDLTADPRNDLSRLLGAVVAPSAEVREGFESYAAVTADGRVVAGLLQDRDAHVVVLRESDGRTVTLPTAEIEELVRQPKSLMPDGLLDRLTDRQVRDLFAYLRGSQPLPE